MRKKDSLLFEVQDSVIGIAQAAQKTLFQPLHRSMVLLPASSAALA